VHSVRLDINDSVFDKVIYFLQNLPKDEVRIVENKIIQESFVEGVDWDYWSDKEIDNIGKIGLMSNSFEEDDEDYLQW
jgi:hypothetical protein